MRSRKGFTLIELLVVIAIIAILAAILFPVFAQAKLAAKKTQSISQIKQAGHGFPMYEGDYDDTFPIYLYRDLGQSQNKDRAWAKACEPYTKNYKFLRCPADPVDPLHMWTTNNQYAWWYNWQQFPSYGMNWVYLDLCKAGCSDFQSYNGIGDYNGGQNAGCPGIVYSQIGSPSQTVEFVTVKHLLASGGFVASETAEPVTGSTQISDACDWSNGGWGAGSAFDGSGLWPSNPTFTGDFAANFGSGGIVCFTDSSAKYMTTGNLAVGTNWRRDSTLKDTQIKTIDLGQYLWDLN